MIIFKDIGIKALGRYSKFAYEELKNMYPKTSARLIFKSIIMPGKL